MAMLDQCTHVSMWYGPGGALQRGADGQALCRHGAARGGRQAAVTVIARTGWQMPAGFKALLVVSFLIAACTPEQAAAPPPTARTSQQMAMLVGRRGAGRPLARGADRRRQQQPGLRQRRRGDARQASGARRARHPRADLRSGRQSVAARGHGGERVERVAHRRRRGLPCLHHQPWRRERLRAEAGERHGEPGDARQCARCRLRRAADRRRGVGLPQRCLSHLRHAPAQSHRAGGGRGRPSSFGCGAGDQYTYFDQCLLQQFDGAATWQQLAATTQTCVENLERKMGIRRPSLPQTFVGSGVADLRIPGRWSLLLEPRAANAVIPSVARDLYCAEGPSLRSG